MGAPVRTTHVCTRSEPLRPFSLRVASTQQDALFILRRAWRGKQTNNQGVSIVKSWHVLVGDRGAYVVTAGAVVGSTCRYSVGSATNGSKINRSYGIKSINSETFAGYRDF